jgi:ribonuclease-3
MRRTSVTQHRDSGPSPEDIQALAERLGHRFADERLLREALVHRSYRNEFPDEPRHNERLEFLGDAVLDLVVAEMLMARLPDSPEGELTRRRAAVVNEQSLARTARRLDLGEVLLLGRGEELNNGRDRSSILADAVEALVGAIYLDAGYSAARDAALDWLTPLVEMAVSGAAPGDHKTALQERMQALGRGSPRYRVVSEDGPDHEKVFEVEISTGETVLARGTGRSKKEAEKEAAGRALAATEEEERGEQ